MPTFYLTKHALTRGIEEAVDCEVDGQWAVRKPGFCMSPLYVHAKIGVDAFPTLREARAKVRAMIDRRLKGLIGQKAKLDTLRATMEDETVKSKLEDWNG